MRREGYCAIITEISSTIVHRRVACSTAATSIEPSGLRNRIRFSDARLQAVSSRNMYSEHGFEALMRPDSGQVCQALIVVSYCTPGSAECQAASAMLSHNARALTLRATLPVVRSMSAHGRSVSTAWRKVSPTRTELLAFWPDTVR